jgi:hypothetical protein
VLVIGCKVSTENLPPNVRLNSDAITAHQTSQAANARSNALSAQATAIQQSTRDAADARATESAIQLAFTFVTATADAKRIEQAALEKTETARDAATASASFATYAAQTPTAKALSVAQTSTAQVLYADQTSTAQILYAGQTSTASAIATGTRRADEYATATRSAAQPTLVFLAAQARDETTRRDREREINKARFEVEMQVAPWIRVAELVTPTCIVLLVFGALAIAVVMIGVAIKKFIEAHTLKTNALALAQVMPVKDLYGNPLGFFTPSGGEIIFQPIEWEIVEGETAPTPPTLLKDSKDAPRQIAPPPEPLIGDFVHVSTLRAFVIAILENDDWTQDTWANKVLPRGYVMSMDTVNDRGETVYGGYSRLLELFVQKHLIVGRRKGSSGKWNPNASHDLEGVMAILENKADLPALPPEPKIEKRALSSPTRKARAAKSAA